MKEPFILQVNQAIEICNTLLSELPLAVEGEVSEFSLSRGKFIFFELKDEGQEARLPCFMMAHQLSSPIENGMRIVVHGSPGLYQKSGKFRLSVQRIEIQGEGSLQRAFQLLLQKLESEGLFRSERKRKIPFLPTRIGVISSVEAAGYGDFIKVASQRLSGVTFTVAHVAVQGKDAEMEIIQAFEALNGHTDIEVIALIRGGGSIEDLHAFNSEHVARAITRSRAPVVVGVGHERDITIADYSADLRASTPSNAAELLLPTKEELLQRVHRTLTVSQHRLEQFTFQTKTNVLHRMETIHQTLLFGVTQYQERVQSSLKSIIALSPEQTLKRGYSLVTDTNKKIIRSTGDIAIGQALTIQFEKGISTTTVTHLYE